LFFVDERGFGKLERGVKGFGLMVVGNNKI
jgi:hypothetical protein